jgi:hypothetical protein
MSETPQSPSNAESAAVEAGIDPELLLRSLRRKQGTWVEWGQACQALQKAGYTPQAIFEATGFEPIHQNQIIVAAQVYASIVSVGVSDTVQSHFSHKGSDILHELRILAQADRASVAELVLEKNLDLDEAHDVAKAVKEFSRFSSLPEGFTNHPGDAIAYQTWKLVRQKSDLQERSRLIAKGLRFAHSAAARKAIETLLTDFTVVPAKPAPRLPLYRLDSADDIPRILPVVGKLPLTKADLQAVPLIDETDPFGMVKFSGTGAWVPLPGWQVIRLADDPIVLLCDSDKLPIPLPGKLEDVLVVVDRAQRQWDSSSYFVVAQGDQLHVQWFETEPDCSLLGQVILIMRPKKVLDEEYTKDPWQIDE